MIYYINKLLFSSLQLSSRDIFYGFTLICFMLESFESSQLFARNVTH